MRVVAVLDPEPMQVQTVGGLPTAISNPYRAPRQLDAVDITGPAGSSALIMVCPTTAPDTTHVVARTNKGDQNTYEAAARVIRIPSSWRVIVQWSTAGNATATLSSSEVDE